MKDWKQLKIIMKQSFDLQNIILLLFITFVFTLIFRKLYWLIFQI